MKKLVSYSLLIAIVIILGGCSNVQNEVENVKEEVSELAVESVNQSEEVINQAEGQVEKITEEMGQAIKHTNQKVEEQLLTSNEKAVVKHDVFVALNEEAYEELYSFIELEKTDEIATLLESNEVKLLEKETEVQVLKVGVTEAKVKVLETNNQVYIPVTYLSQV